MLLLLMPACIRIDRIDVQVLDKVRVQWPASQPASGEGVGSGNATDSRTG